MDFLEVVYEPRGDSAGTGGALRHDGYEYGLIVSGTLQARVGFESYELGEGDSIAFDSATRRRSVRSGRWCTRTRPAPRGVEHLGLSAWG